MKEQMIITMFSLAYGISNTNEVENIIRQNIGLDIYTLVN